MIRENASLIRDIPLSVLVYAMNAALRFVLTGTQGGQIRIRVLEALGERPRTASQLADEVGVSRRTLEHHLEVLAANDVVERRGAGPQAAYRVTRETRADWADVEELFDRAGEPSTPLIGTFLR